MVRFPSGLWKYVRKKKLNMKPQQLLWSIDNWSDVSLSLACRINSRLPRARLITKWLLSDSRSIEADRALIEISAASLRVRSFHFQISASFQGRGNVLIFWYFKKSLVAVAAFQAVDGYIPLNATWPNTETFTVLYQTSSFWSDWLTGPGWWFRHASRLIGWQICPTTIDEPLISRFQRLLMLL